MAAAPVLEFRGVTKSFGELEVLRGIDLAVREHEAVALIGASGSGKSTLLRCVDLLEEIDDGDIFLDGEVITDPSVDPVAVRRRLGLIFQAYNLFPHLTALENVVLGMVRGHGAERERGRDGRPGAARALRPRRAARTTRPTTSRAASSSGWRSPAPSPPARARCCSTRSPARSTRSSSARCSRRSATSRREGVTMLLATHEMSFAREVADTVCFLHEGRLLEVGPPEQVLEAPREPETQRFLRRLLEAGRA